MRSRRTIVPSSLIAPVESLVDARAEHSARTGPAGMIVVPAFQPALYGFEAATGRVVSFNPLENGNWLYGATTIANGLLYYGDGFGAVHALRFPASPPPPQPGEPPTLAASATSLRLAGPQPPPPPFVTRAARDRD
jgi:hypothetical protein